MPKFDDLTIEGVCSAEDAENEDDDRFKQYFFFNRSYEKLIVDLPIRILVGHIYDLARLSPDDRIKSNWPLLLFNPHDLNKFGRYSSTTFPAPVNLKPGTARPWSG